MGAAATGVAPMSHAGLWLGLAALVQGTTLCVFVPWTLATLPRAWVAHNGTALAACYAACAYLLAQTLGTGVLALAAWLCGRAAGRPHDPLGLPAELVLSAAVTWGGMIRAQGRRTARLEATRPFDD